MNRMNRRRFVAVTSVAATSVVLVACGNDKLSEEELNPTQIPDVAGAPPTIAPLTSTPGAAAPADNSGGGDTGGGGTGAVMIEAHDDFSFTPADVEVSPGQTVTLTNTGFAQHDLAVDDWGIQTDLLNGGDSGDLVIPEDAEVGSTFDFHCTVPGHKESGMVGTFTIVEAGAAAPAGDGAATTDAGGDSSGPVAIEANDDFSFTPADVDVAPGQTITLTNAGFAQHDLAVDDWGIQTDLLNGGDSGDLVIPEDAEVGSTFDFHCTVPGHKESGMVGTFTIVEAGAAAAPAGDTEEATAEDGTADAGAGSSGPVAIEANDDFSFTPADVDVAPGQTVTLTNAGFAQHDLAVDDWGIQTDLLNGGDSGDVVIPEDAEVGSTFDFHCTVPGHKESGMVGTFTIVEAGAAAAPAGDTEEATAEEGTAEAGTGSSGPVAIEANDDFSFTPSEVEVSPGQTVTLTNAGFAQHDLAVDDWGVQTDMLNGGDSGNLVIPEDAEVGSTFDFHCTVVGHKESGMVGTFTVVAAGAAAAPAGDTEEATAAATAEETSNVDTAALTADNNPSAVTVVGTQWQFEPAEFEVAPGGVITFQNETDMMMGMSSDAWDDGSIPMIRSVGAGNSGEFTVPEDAEVGSTVEFKSNLTEAEGQGMVGTITIVEGDAAAASPAATPEGEAAAGSGNVIEIKMLDSFEFDPAEFEASVGDTLKFTNEGFMDHDAVVDDWSEEPLTDFLKNGETAEVVVPDAATAGEQYEMYCSVPGHKQAGMIANITIV